MDIWGQFRRSLVIAWKDIKIFYYKGPVVIFGVLFPLFLYFSFVIGRDLPPSWVVPGLLGTILFFTATSISPVVLPWEGQARTLERLMSAPVLPETIILGDIIASLTFGAAVSSVALLGALAFGVKIGSPLVLAAGYALASLCFSALGNIFSVPPTNLPATANMIAAVIRFPIVFISGVFIPLPELPGWARFISFFSPLTYFADLARASIQGSSYFPPWIDVLVLLLFCLLFISAAMYLHKRTMYKRLT